jgi:hypothetical protein
MDKVTKAEVKRALKDARYYMRIVESLLETDDFTEAGRLGQTIMYVQAEISTAEAYRMHKEEAARGIKIYNG